LQRYEEPDTDWMTMVANRMRSVRARTTTGALLVVGTALLVAATALVATMERAMEGNIKDAAVLRANDLVGQLEEGTPVDELSLGEDDDVVVQVIASDGEILAASPTLDGQRVLAAIGPGQSTTIERSSLDDDPFVVVARGAVTGDDRVTVLVGRNLDLVKETISIVTRILLVAIPLLLLIVGLTTWRVAGRALAPVEAMRQEVTAISASELHRRVPEPDGDDEIARLSHTMNDMLERLEKARQRQQQLVSDASHELRNPISVIRNHAEVTLKHPDSTDVVSLASDVLSEDLRLQQLADNLLFLARADEHTLELSTRPLDLDDVVLEEARRISLSTSLTVDTAGVGAARTAGDKPSLQRVVRNLADNAARHATTAVSFTLKETDGQVILHVDDDGPGIPEDARASVFERFTRLDEARDRGHGGAGLGLAIVAEAVAAHGGTATVVDAPIGGARFEIVLPRTER
jgi:signal transduction histidine kinase